LEGLKKLFASNSSAKKSKHSLDSVMPELQGATGALQAEIARLEEQEAELAGSMAQIVGNLSELRYGKFANPKLRDEVMDGLTALQEACERKT
jgi:centromere-localized protein 2